MEGWRGGERSASSASDSMEAGDPGGEVEAEAERSRRGWRPQGSAMMDATSCFALATAVVAEAVRFSVADVCVGGWVVATNEEVRERRGEERGGLGEAMSTRRDSSSRAAEAFCSRARATWVSRSAVIAAALRRAGERMEASFAEGEEEAAERRGGEEGEAAR